MIRHILCVYLMVSPVLVHAQQAGETQAAALRVLDRLTGELTDVVISAGQTYRRGNMELEVRECRYPAASPYSDAFVWVEVRDITLEDPVVFEGWMVASSPALSAMDHSRYDVWPLRCRTSATE